MSSKIPLGRGRGRGRGTTPGGQPTSSNVTGVPGPPPKTKTMTPKPSMIPRINFKAGAKSKIDTGLIRKKPVQKQVVVDPVPVVVEDLTETETGICNNLDIDIASPKWTNGKMAKWTLSDSEDFEPPKNHVLEDSVPETSFVEQNSRPTSATTNTVLFEEPDEASPVRGIQFSQEEYANSGMDAFYDEDIFHLLPPSSPSVDDVNQNYQLHITNTPEVPIGFGVSIQEMTAPPPVHESISDPKLGDDPSVELELEERPSICKEEPPFMVESVVELADLIDLAPTKVSEEEEEAIIHVDQISTSSTKSFSISKDTPTSSDTKMESVQSPKKSFSEIISDANSKTNPENLELMEKAMEPFLDAPEDPNTEETNVAEEQEEQEKVDQVPVPEEAEPQNDPRNNNEEEICEVGESNEEIVEELLRHESLDDALSISSDCLRQEMSCLRSGVSDMQMWSSVTLYLASGAVIIAILGMQNLRGFMETSFAPPQAPTAVGWWTSMYRTIFGGAEQ